MNTSFLARSVSKCHDQKQPTQCLLRGAKLIKRPTLIAALWAVCAVCPHQSVAATSAVDPTLVPFKKGELQQKLEANKDNVHALILLLLRADEMSSSRVNPAFSRLNPKSYNTQALQGLQQMRRRYPNNMKVLSAYCFSLDIDTQGMHREFSNYGEWSPEKEQKVQATLKELREKAPKLWVSYAIEGYRLFYRGEKTPAEQNQGIQLLAKAIELAPTVPILRSRYARVCRYASDWQQKGRDDRAVLYGVAITQCEKALQLRPPSSEAALSLSRGYLYGSGLIRGDGLG